MYKVAIPSYKRADALLKKSLLTLSNGRVNSSRIYIFVANEEEQQIYETTIPKYMYHKIVVGKIGIANQRIFIRNYFKEGEYIVSIDDDVEGLFKLKGEKLAKIHNIDAFFKHAYKILKREKLFLWGIYPVGNPFFMKGKHRVSTSLKFIIGVLHGYIVRKDKNLNPSTSAEGKEDYEQSILYYKRDGGVLRFNDVAAKTKFLAKGGLGEIDKRFEMNRKAAAYLHKTYPDLVTIFHRQNGMTEIRLKDKSAVAAGSTKIHKRHKTHKRHKKRRSKKTRRK
jgi:hypothetical protein